MAVKIRLKRLGKVRVPQYRIVVVDSRKKRDGRVIEEIGKYHPKEDPSLIEVSSERAQYWLGVGAQPSEPVAALLKITGDWQTFKGEEGAEGTLKTKPEKRSKLDIFNEALKEAGGDRSAAEAVSKRPAKKAEAKKAESATVEQDVEKVTEKDASAAVEEVVEDATVEPIAPVPGDQTPEGAAEVAEAAEEITAEDAGKSES